MKIYCWKQKLLEIQAHRHTADYDHGPLMGVSKVWFKLVPRDLIAPRTPVRALGPFLLWDSTLKCWWSSKPNRMAIYDHGPLMGVSKVWFKLVPRDLIAPGTPVRALGPFLLWDSTLKCWWSSKPNQIAIYDHGPFIGVSEVWFKLVPRNLILTFTPARALGPFLLHGSTFKCWCSSKPNQIAIYDHGPFIGVTEV